MISVSKSLEKQELSDAQNVLLKIFFKNWKYEKKIPSTVHLSFSHEDMYFLFFSKLSVESGSMFSVSS